MLDELVREYCVYRGIVDSVLASPSGESIVFLIIYYLLTCFFFFIIFCRNLVKF